MPQSSAMKPCYVLSFCLSILLTGCGDEPLPSQPEDPALNTTQNKNPWPLRSDAQLDSVIEAAKKQATSESKMVLLDFGAEWCPDCREVVRLSGEGEAKKVIDAKYVPVHVNVGRFDRHAALIATHKVKKIAKLVVMKPDGEVVAQTTLEPISNKSGMTPADLAKWLQDPMAAPSPAKPATAPSPVPAPAVPSPSKPVLKIGQDGVKVEAPEPKPPEVLPKD